MSADKLRNSDEMLSTEVGELLHEHNILCEEERQVSQLDGLRSGGAEELISVVGAARFCDAVNRALTLKTKRVISMHDVVREIEPDPAKREQLYQQIVTKAESDPRYKAGTNHRMEIGGNVPEAVRTSVEGWRKIDNAAGRIPLIGSIVERLRQGGQRAQVSSERLLELTPLSSDTAGQIEANGGLHQWHEFKQRESASSHKELLRRGREIVQRITAAIAEKTQELERKHHLERSDLEHDMKQVEGLRMRSSTGQEISAHAAASLTNATSEFDQRVRGELERATAPYRTMLDTMPPALKDERV